MRPKPRLRTYKFEFSCVLYPSEYNVKTDDNGKRSLDVVHGFVEGAHYHVEVDYTVADVERYIVNPPQFDKACEAMDDLIDRRFDGCPILTSPIADPTADDEDEPHVQAIEALTRGRAYFLRDLDADTFAKKFFDVARSHEFNVAAEEVRVRRAGEEFTAVYRETDDEA